MQLHIVCIFQEKGMSKSVFEGLQTGMSKSVFEGLQIGLCVVCFLQEQGTSNSGVVGDFALWGLHAFLKNIHSVQAQLKLQPVNLCCLQ